MPIDVDSMPEALPRVVYVKSADSAGFMTKFLGGRAPVSLQIIVGV